MEVNPGAPAYRVLQDSESSAESKQAVFPLASGKASAEFQGERVEVEVWATDGFHFYSPSAGCFTLYKGLPSRKRQRVAYDQSASSCFTLKRVSRLFLTPTTM